MRTSSARQLELDDLYETLPFDKGGGTSGATTGAGLSDASTTASSALRIPDFRSNPQVFADMARLAGRLNAASISDREHQLLLDERQGLLDKKFDETITRKEAARLALVRWSLDRIEDARHGFVLDMLEDNVNMYERFAADLNSLKEQLWQHTGRRK